MAIDADTFSVGARFHGVKGLICIADMIVTIQRDTKTTHYPLQIDLPGGGRENNESPFQTLAREVHEELGITLLEPDIIYSRRYHNTLQSNEDTFFMVTREFSINEHTIVFGEKGIMYILMTTHQFIHHRNAVVKQKNRIIDYLKYLQSNFNE